MSAIRSSGSAKVRRRTRRPRSGSRRRPTSAADATSREAGVLDRMRREPVAAARPALRPAEREHAGVLARAVVLQARSAPDRTRARPRSAGAFASRLRTAASCSGEARCEADAIAISSLVRSSRARTSGSAWNGFAEERRYATRSGSPACSTTAPSRTATACTRCVASSTSPRWTTIRSGCTRGSLEGRVANTLGLVGSRLPDDEAPRLLRRRRTDEPSARVGGVVPRGQHGRTEELRHEHCRHTAIEAHRRWIAARSRGRGAGRAAAAGDLRQQPRQAAPTATTTRTRSCSSA